MPTPHLGLPSTEMQSAYQRAQLHANSATIVSLMPWSISENKPGLTPCNFTIPACPDQETPSVVHISRAGFFVYMGDGRSYKIDASADSVAHSLVEDYCTAHLEAVENCRPALLWFSGYWTWEEIQRQPEMLEKLAVAREQQMQWFERLCRLADSDWAKYQRHNVITDIQRIGAQLLRLKPEQHPWLRITRAIEQTIAKCPACATPKLEGAIICSNCKAVFDKEAYDQLTFVQS